LSEFTGAATELKQALLVNPFDLEEMADKIHYALQLPKSIRQAKMSFLRETIAANDIYHWVKRFLERFCHVATHCT
jgi:trehalose 6-phosphate synthase/phosphatase